MKRYWMELSSPEHAALPDNTLAILPVAAVEQHGPHLPVGTDCLINNSIIAAMLKKLGDDVPAVVLPLQPVGASQEHLDYAGSLAHPASDLMQSWTRILDCAVRSTGLKRLLIFNSHGGQSGLLSVVALDQRVRHNILAAYATWFDSGYPEGLFTDDEIRTGFHGGDIETSMMLALHPDLVAMGRAEDFRSAVDEIEGKTAQLSANPGGGRVGGLGWKAQDLHPDGVTGDASRATAEKGRVLLDHAATALAALVGDLTSVEMPDGNWPPAQYRA
ncbi:creatininase family protein [Martelella sp. HB161492]|uniref:creatininase family protein n=1 Tax=Martelella sp. HB161492 TaxID=2720726 RepID=UPI00159251BE|nr:creatininase family protein [Martelella sp. HB161492]